MARVLVVLLLVALIPLSAPPASADTLSSTRCSPADAYCITLELSELAFACEAAEDDAYTCDLSGVITATGTGPAGLFGRTTFRGFIELGLCGACTQIYEEPTGSCTWSTSGTCTTETTFHVHGIDSAYDGCFLGWGYISVEAMTRPLTGVNVNAARTTAGGEIGWFDNGGCL